MKWMALVAVSIVVIACIGGIFFAWRNFLTIMKAYNHYLEEITENAWVTICGLLVRTSDSLLMKNNGDDPCMIEDAIPYVDYVGDMSLFYEVTK